MNSKSIYKNKDIKNMKNENQIQNNINENSIENFLSESSINNIKNNNYEKKSYIANNEQNESVFPPSSIIYNQNKFRKLSLSEFFKKIIVNDMGAHIILESYNDDAIWRKELSTIPVDKGKIIPKITIPLHELAAAPVISRRFMNLHQFNVKELISDSVKEDFSFKIDKAILFGNGENQPKGILSYDTSLQRENNKLLSIKFNINEIIPSLMSMESALDAKYLNEEESIWIISRKLYILLQKEIFKLNNHPLVNSGIFGFSREGTVNYLFNRPLLIVDGLESDQNNKNKIEIILVHKNAYTVIENPHMEYIENQQDLDLRLFFIKYYGGGVTNYKGVVMGYMG
jgi:HK97 family phage major capsid protein